MKKTFLLITSLLLTSTSFAAGTIANSKLEDRHQTLIANAIYTGCGAVGSIKELATQINEKKIDQGQIDLEFISSFELSSKVDQMVFDKYLVEVQSVKSSNYDHVNQTSGTYLVTSVKCTLL